jgi:hypothetical protein
MSASTLSSPTHILGQYRTAKTPLISVPNSWLANSNRTHSADYLALRQMPVAHNQPLAILITPILVELNIVDYLVFDRRLQ